MVLTAHVHNYQRIERNILKDRATPFLVAGHGGYFHLHHLNAAAGTTDNQTGATLKFGDDKRHGYVTLNVDADHISGTATAAQFGQNPVPGLDPFQYSAKLQMLPANAVVNL